MILKSTLLLLALLGSVPGSSDLEARQRVEQARAAEEAIVVGVNKSTIVESPVPLNRISIANSEIAEAVVVSPREVLVNGRQTGSTSLILWGVDGSRNVYTVEVILDAETLERNLRSLFPEEEIQVVGNRDAYVLSGSVSEESVARRMRSIAEATGATVVDNMAVPAPRQILLQVRFAEVNRNAIRQLGLNVTRVDPFNVRGDDEGAISTGQFNPPSGGFLDGTGPDETFSDAVNLFLFEPDWNVGTFIRALKGRGMFKSLAEPNLLALDGKEASFLAGGEFPYPVPQTTGGGNQTITIVFKEFGVRLNFLPQITNSGNINLQVSPEVSSLDFASGLSIQGFEVPALRSRRAETEVELRDGQTFAIAGLIDNSITENADKIPILGDIPILGRLFSSENVRQNRSELLVLVTPHLVEPADREPPIPSGEPEQWDWMDPLELPTEPNGEGS